MLMLRVRTQIDRYGSSGAYGFVIERPDGIAEYGYAAASWLVDLLQWVHRPDVPDQQAHQILGLMLGYSAHAIRLHDEACSCANRFQEPYVD